MVLFMLTEGDNPSSRRQLGGDLEEGRVCLEVGHLTSESKTMFEVGCLIEDKRLHWNWVIDLEKRDYV
jgi:hypothetical protein